MNTRYEHERKQKHIWQIGFVVLSVAVFALSYMAYKDKPAVKDKLARLFHQEPRVENSICELMTGDVIRNNPIELQEIARPQAGGR